MKKGFPALITETGVSGCITLVRDSVVLDTNVLLDWLVFRDPRTAWLETVVVHGRVRWTATQAMRAELVRMLGHRSMAARSPDAAAAIAVFDAHAVICEPAAQCGLRCTDADDQMFIDLAVERRARWLLTHDRALLRLARPARARGVSILTPMVWAAQMTPGFALQGAPPN